MTKINLGMQQHFPNSTYSCAVEIEISEDASQDELKQEVKATLKTIREAIQDDVAEAMPVDIKALPVTGSNIDSKPRTHPPQVQKTLTSRKTPKPASAKQLSYVQNICNERGIDPTEVAQQHGVQDIEHLSGQACWRFIDHYTKK